MRRIEEALLWACSDLLFLNLFPVKTSLMHDVGELVVIF